MPTEPRIPVADLIGLQPGQPGEGDGYNPSKSLPYPLYVGPDDRCENVPGYPMIRKADRRDELPILVGFQPDVDTQRVVLMADEWRKNPASAVGLVPVFYEPGGFKDGMFSLGVLITSIPGNPVDGLPSHAEADEIDAREEARQERIAEAQDADA